MICVLGMHRSGTSMVCQLMHALGVDFGDPASFYATDRWNEAGYFEARDVMDVNSRLITGFPRNRRRLAAEFSKVRYMMMPGPMGIARRARALRPEIECLSEKYASLAVKDPRFCLTFGHWDRVRTIERVVVCYRHPMEVASSLLRRQRIPLAMGYRFWNYHAASLLDELPAERVVLVDFNRLGGQEGLGQARLLSTALGLATSDASCREAVESVFQRELVHCKVHDETAMPVTTRRLWERMLTMADQARMRWALAALPAEPAGTGA